MINVSNEVIPYAIYCIAIIFYVASLQKKKRKTKKKGFQHEESSK